MKFNLALYDVFRFCRIQQIQWVLGFPDFNGCFMSRSHLQSTLDLQEPEFWTCLCHNQRSTFLLKQVVDQVGKRTDRGLPHEVQHSKSEAQPFVTGGC